MSSSVTRLCFTAALASSAELLAPDHSRWCCRFAAACCANERKQIGIDTAPSQQLAALHPRRRLHEEAAAKAEEVGALEEGGEEEEEGGEEGGEEEGGDEEEEEEHIKEWWEPAYAEYKMDPVTPFQYLSLLFAAIAILAVLACIVICAPKSSLLYRSWYVQL